MSRPWYRDAPAPPDYRDPTADDFTAVVAAGRPAVLRGAVADWPLVAAGRTSPAALAAALRARATDAAGEAWFAAPAIDGRFGWTPDLAGHNHDRRAATIDQLLDLLLRQQGAEAPWAVFAGALPVARHLPGLLADHPPPFLPADRRMLVSLWLGNRTHTAAHWDLPQNLACVVAGRRRFVLFPTAQVGNLYVGPLDRTLAGQPSSLVDVDTPDLARFPRFADAMAAAEVAWLEPGDVLYLPSLWWHAVATDAELGAMVNFWWRDAPAGATTPLPALMHALLTLRDLPAGERDAWRSLFDHYVFADDGTAAAHLPAAAQGALGARSAERDATLRRLIAATLA